MSGGCALPIRVPDYITVGVAVCDTRASPGCPLPACSPFGVVSRPVYQTSAGSKLGSGSEGFEPTDAVKGNVARAMLYFIVRYHDKNIQQGMNYNDFWTSRVELFLQWNRQDPPDAAERRRNDMSQAFQGNRNPFIDHPEYVWAIFGDAANDSKLYVGSSAPADGASTLTVDFGTLPVGAALPAAGAVPAAASDLASDS
jgi:hypothetical protein